MKYFVAYLLTGSAKAYHERLTKELAARYRIRALHERVPPHMTFKIPFEADADQVLEVERVLRSYVAGKVSPTVELTGFGHFGFRTIYLNGEGRDAAQFVRGALKSLRDNIAWLPQPPLEGNKLHASVARFLTRRKFLRIWKDVKGLAPRFHVTLDNLAILKQQDGAWKVHAFIPVGTSGGPAKADAEHPLEAKSGTILTV